MLPSFSECGIAPDDAHASFATAERSVTARTVRARRPRRERPLRKGDLLQVLQASASLRGL